MLAEAHEQIKELDGKLKAVVEGGIDETVRQQLADVEKLKKKIKSLEEENEEFEDNLKSCKKKLNGKEGDCIKLRDDLDSVLREKKQLQEDLQKTTEALEEKVREYTRSRLEHISL